jgi:3-oxoadipate enol-lactonase
MPWADVNGISMYYESHGQGEAIIFAHGAGGNHLSWWQQVPFFRQKHRCVTFDHRGFGRSVEVESGPGANAFAEDLRALMDTLEIERTYLVAQSMGGGTCMGFTVAHPERVKGLVMADTTGTMTDAKLADLRREYQESLPSGQTLAGRAYNPDLWNTRPHMAFLYDSVMALNPRRAEASGERDARHVATTEKLAALTVPVQFIVGEKDVIVPPNIIKHAATLIPGARFNQVPVSGHSVYFEEPEAFNRIVSEFIESVERAASK